MTGDEDIGAASSGATDKPTDLTPFRAPESRDFDIRIGRDGTWYYQNSPINRIKLVKLFAAVLRRADDGAYHLTTPAEDGRIAVDDAPFVAVDLDAAGAGKAARLTFRTNLDEHVTAGPDHPIRVETDPESGEPSPYVMVRNGLEALINRAVFYDLVALGVEERVGGANLFGVWSADSFFPLGDIESDD